MKPKRYKPEFAIQAFSEDQARRFVFPDLDTIAPAGILDGGGGTPRVVVAPSDSSDLSKGKADFFLSGVGDETDLQTIINDFGSDGGRLLLTEGNINFSDNGLWTITGPTRVEGMSKDATRILGTSQSALVLPGDFGSLEHVGVYNGSSNAAARAVEIVGSFAHVSDCVLDCAGAIAIEVDGDECMVDHNWVSDGAIDVTSGGRHWVTHNQVEDGFIRFVGFQNHIGLNSVWTNGHGIVVSSATDSQVIGNIIESVSLASSNTFDGVVVDGDRNLIAHNTVIPTSTGNTTRSGVNINSGNNNAAYLNYLGGASDYGTASFIDAATGTITAPDADGQFTF